MQPKMNGRNSKQFGWTKEQLSYCVKDFIMYTFVMYMIKRNFLNPYFSFYVFFLWNQLTYVITEIADAEPIY